MYMYVSKYIYKLLEVYLAYEPLCNVVGFMVGWLVGWNTGVFFHSLQSAEANIQDSKFKLDNNENNISHIFSFMSSMFSPQN